MKKYCKHIDISDREFIEKAIWDCLQHRSRSDRYRKDISRIVDAYGGIRWMARHMSEDIKKRDLHLPPVKEDRRRDKNNGKIRDITISDIWHQFYDYVASHALKEPLKRLGFYQCGCVDGKGQIWGVKMLKGFANKYRYISHADAKKCYRMIPQDRLMAFLRRIIKNDPLLWLIETLIKHSCATGISIGSRLSIPLCQLYLSQAYHHMSEMHKYRRSKRIAMVKAQLYFMDDIFMASDNASDLVKANKELSRYFKEVLGMEIKPTWFVVDTANATLDAMGFRIHKDYIKMRRINYVKTKRALKTFVKTPTLKNALSLMSRATNIKYSDSLHFRKKYHWKNISRIARRIISHESKILNNATGNCGNRRWQYDLLPDCTEYCRSGSNGSRVKGVTHGMGSGL